MPSPVTSGLITVTDGSEANAVTYSYTTSFYQRLAQIAVAVCYAVCREDPTTTGHAARASRALQFIANSASQQAQIQLAQFLLQDLSLSLSSTSQQIADKLAAQFDTWAGN